MSQTKARHKQVHSSVFYLTQGTFICEFLIHNCLHNVGWVEREHFINYNLKVKIMGTILLEVELVQKHAVGFTVDFVSDIPGCCQT